MSKEVSFEGHLNGLFWDLEFFVFVVQAKDFVKSDLVTASIIDDILTIQESYITNVREDIDNAYKGDVLKAIF